MMICNHLCIAEHFMHHSLLFFKYNLECSCFSPHLHKWNGSIFSSVIMSGFGIRIPLISLQNVLGGFTLSVCWYNLYYKAINVSKSLLKPPRGSSAFWKGNYDYHSNLFHALWYLQDLYFIYCQFWQCFSRNVSILPWLSSISLSLLWHIQKSV